MSERCPKCGENLAEMTLVGDAQVRCPKCRELVTAVQTDAASLTPEQVRSLWGQTIPAGAEATQTLKQNRKSPDSSEDSSSVSSRLTVHQQKVVTNRGEIAPPPQYEILDILGEGGMGVVYAARQTSVDRKIALKMIKSDVAQEKLHRDKFLSEAVATADLDHPNIVPVYDLGSNQEGVLFYAMKEVKGTSWKKVLPEKSLEENLDILMRVADAVAFAHSKGVIHRDLKPENVMLGDFGEVLLMDWGLAVSVNETGKADRLCTANSFGGTPSYMAPELVSGDLGKIGPGTDVYLLGAMLYEFVTGKRPHASKNPLECLEQAGANVIQPTEKQGELVEIALQAMATEPRERYGSVKEFQMAIRNYRAHAESLAMMIRAREGLLAAQKSKDYRIFARRVMQFEEALSLWPENEEARKCASEARLQYAECAFEKGDLDLSVSLLDKVETRHAELLARVMAARDERESRKRRLKLLTRTAAGLGVVVIVVLSVASVLITQQWRRADRESDRARAELIRRQELETARDNRRRAQVKEAEAEKQKGLELFADIDKGKTAEARHKRLVEVETHLSRAMYLLGEGAENLAVDQADVQKIKTLSDDVLQNVRNVCEQHMLVSLEMNNLALAEEKILLAQRAGLKDPDAWRERMKDGIKKIVAEHFAAVKGKKIRTLDYYVNALVALKSPVCVRSVEENLDRVVTEVVDKNQSWLSSIDELKLAIRALAGLREEISVARLLPLVEKKWKTGRDIEIEVRGEAFRAICRIAPLDRDIYEKLYKVIWDEPGDQSSQLFLMVKDDWEIFSALVLNQKESIIGEPKDAKAWYELGTRYGLTGEFDKSIRCYDKALELNPGYADAYNNRGISKFNKAGSADKKELESAIVDFNKVIELDPRDKNIFANRAGAKAQKGDLDGAIADYAVAIESDPRNHTSYLNRGTVRYRKKDMRGAIEDYSKAIEINPKNADSFNMRGNVKHAEGDLNGAMDDYSKAIELNPRFAGAYANRGGVKGMKDDLNGAMLDYTKAIEMDPRNTAAYVNRGVVKRLKDDLDGAMADCDKAIELDPDNEDAYANRGVGKGEKGDFEGAVADCNKVIELNPHNAIGYYGRASVKRNKGDLDGAVIDYGKAIEIDPRHWGAFENRGIVKNLKGEVDGAIIDLTKAIELDPATAKHRAVRGLIFCGAERFVEAQQDFIKALALTGTNSSMAVDIWLGSFLVDMKAGKSLIDIRTVAQKFRAENKLKGWTGAEFAWFCGDIDDAAFFVAARSKNKVEENKQLCEAYFCAGSLRLIKGDKAAAVELFEKSVATGGQGHVLYTLAAGELKRLKDRKSEKESERK